MSVRHALLALLSEGSKYGLQLRQEFEARTGEVWPLNVGQVYLTLQRLERDGLIESERRGPSRSAEGVPHHAGRWRGAGRVAQDAAGPGQPAARRAGDQGARRAAPARRRRASISCRPIAGSLVELMQRYTHIKAGGIGR